MRFKSLFALMLISLPLLARAESVSVSAAISLKDALTDIAARYEKQTGDHVGFQFGSSGQLAAQIRQGAPVDLFISAARKQVDELAKDGGFVDAGSAKVIAGNSLVLVVPASAKDQPPARFEDLQDAKFKRIAIGDPKTVPAGDYAMQVLNALKVADAVSPRLVSGANVRQVLSYVERGEVAAGIVYKTDALESGDKVLVVATADPKLHKPIEYPAAILTAAKNPTGARKFELFLTTDDARTVFAAHGFALPPESASTTQPSKPSAHE